MNDEVSSHICREEMNTQNKPSNDQDAERKMTNEEMVAILVALSKGKQIEEQVIGKVPWRNFEGTHQLLDFQNYQYRVKAELLECWANTYETHTDYWKTDQTASRVAARGNTPIRIAVFMKEPE